VGECLSCVCVWYHFRSSRQLAEPSMCPCQAAMGKGVVFCRAIFRYNGAMNNNRTSHPWRSLNPCSSREMPPITATVRTPRWLPNLIASSSICCASSLVGARIIAYGPISASSNLHQHRTDDTLAEVWSIHNRLTRMSTNNDEIVIFRRGTVSLAFLFHLF